MYWGMVGGETMCVGVGGGGVTLLEQDIVERRPQYADYIRRTNAFFPGPPRP